MTSVSLNEIHLEEPGRTISRPNTTVTMAYFARRITCIWLPQFDAQTSPAARSQHLLQAP